VITRRNAPLALPPLTARSVLLSTLLGLDPPALPTARLVATARLFGIEEGTARVALSRMVAAGEVEADEGRYRLAGRLLERQRRQAAGRRPPGERWDGGWHLIVITAARRAAADRADLRTMLTGSRLAQWREGVWTRPDNLPAPTLPEHLAHHGTWLTAVPDTDTVALAAALWPLGEWAATARSLLAHLGDTRPPLDAGDTTALAPGFVLSAAVLRHLAADPLLPAGVLPVEWPGPELRAVYDTWDGAYRALLASWHRAHP
jgi:phenylacetic acid degradation operon negative regulatory protein